MDATINPKAAEIAGREVGTAASTAAMIAVAHGYRWNRHGAWRRLAPGEPDEDGSIFRGPSVDFQLSRGDLMIIDEAGMLDQETARALLTIADESNARIALIGDRYQLPAVGRGGVLDMAVQWAPEQVEMSAVHRFVKETVTASGEVERTPDAAYGELSLQMRRGDDPGAVFDALAKRGAIQVHSEQVDALAALAHEAATAHREGRSAAVSVGTNDEAELINQAVHDYLASTGELGTDDGLRGNDGLPIVVGSRVMTRRNDSEAGVANRQTWTVDSMNDGQVNLVNSDGVLRTVSAAYTRDHVHLAWAATTYGVQGVTARTGAVLITDSVDSASMYVGMTRGRIRNDAHLVADSVTAAREQWINAAERDRADLGLEHARAQVLKEAAGYRDEPDNLSDRLDRAVAKSRQTRVEDLQDPEQQDETSPDQHHTPRNPRL